ncbi:MAG: hypothetical protein WBA10_16375, partial [Elainellaceae cyanobacterium]
MTQSSNIAADPAECLEQWVSSLAKSLDTAIKWRRRGNSLHILCEAQTCPDQERVTAQVNALLSRQNVNIPGQPPIYQLWCYGRSAGEYRPKWSTAIAPGPVAESCIGTVAPEASNREFSEPVTGAKISELQASELQAPKAQTPRLDPQRSNSQYPKSHGPDEAVTTIIPQRLAKILSPLGIAVTARIKPNGSSAKRLWIACQASYSPAPNLIAEPIAAEIRQLSLPGVRDAVVLVKVRGEERVDWVLKIDLTPAEDILKGWARWGDVEAISRLLNVQLAGRLGGQVTDGMVTGTMLKFVYHTTSETALPNNDAEQSVHIDQVLTSLSAYLQTLSPQGIHALQITEAGGRSAQQHSLLGQAIPQESAWNLARMGELAAVRFLLGRMLNPDLDQQLATGGIRVQVLLKEQLLHVMCDSPLCPEEAAVAEPVQDLVKQLAVPLVHGVRVYGRRAGQRRPRWRTGTNFDKQRFVPEPSPTFAATDAYVAQLMSPEADPAEHDGPDTASPRQPLWTVWGRAVGGANQRLRQALLRSQLFVPGVNARDLVQPSRDTSRDVQLAVVWGAVGLLLFTQADLLTGWWADSRASAAAPLSQVITGQAVAGQANALADEPLTADEVSALIQQSPFPSFNNPHLDLKLALYHQRLQTADPPDVVIIGSSRAMRSIDPAILKTELADLGYPEATVFNFGVNGATAQVVDLILRRILQPQQLPKLVIWADGARAFNQGRTDETYQAMVTSDGYRDVEGGALAVGADSADVETAALSSDSDQDSASPRASRLLERYQALDRWLSDRLGLLSTAHPHRDRLKAWIAQRFDVGVPQHSLQEQVASLEQAAQPTREGAPESRDASMALSITTSTPSDQIRASGFLPIDMRFDPSTYYQKYAQVPGNYDKDYLNFDMRGAQTEALRQVLELAEAQDMTLVFVNTPLTQEYLDPFRAGHEQTFRQYMIDTALQHESFTFRDLSRLWLDRPDHRQYFS